MNNSTTYKHPQAQRTIDGGYSGAITVTARRIKDGTTLMSVDSGLLGNLVLTSAQAAELSKALAAAAAEQVD
jgi:hypothetical protein